MRQPHLLSYTPRRFCESCGREALKDGTWGRSRGWCSFYHSVPHSSFKRKGRR